MLENAVSSLLFANMSMFKCFIVYSSSPNHLQKEPILPDEDPEKAATLVHNIKESLDLQANILDYDQKESFDSHFSVNEYKKEVIDEQIPAMIEYKDIIKENMSLNREILFLKQQLLEKERKIKRWNTCLDI